MGSALLIDVAGAMWPNSRVQTVCAAGTSGREERDYVVLPTLRSPRWLLPADVPCAAAVLTAPGTSPARQAAVRLLTWAHHAGLTRRPPFTRLRVQSSGASLMAALSARLGADVAVAIRLGSWEHARSLTLRAFAGDGSTRAFGKVGLDRVGCAAVRAERAGLARVAELDVPLVAHPDVLHHFDWHGLEVLLVSPLVAPAGESRLGDMPVEAMGQLAEAAGQRQGVLSTSGWLRGVRNRIHEVADPHARSLLESVLGRLEEGSSGVEMPFGCWHGDWTPWNMAWDGPRVLLWDWEHFAEDVPLGFDHVHHLAQRLRQTAGTGPREERVWLAQSAEVLGRRLGLTETQRAVLPAAYLLEVNLRYVLDRQGTQQESDVRAGWGMGLLRSETDRLVTARASNKQGVGR